MLLVYLPQKYLQREKKLITLFQNYSLYFYSLLGPDNWGDKTFEFGEQLKIFVYYLSVLYSNN